MHIPLIGQLPQHARTIEICRSFSGKLNHQLYGGNPYESSDYFASRKIEVPEDQAAEESERIHQECRAEVQAAMLQTIARLKAKAVQRQEKVA